VENVQHSAMINDDGSPLNGTGVNLGKFQDRADRDEFRNTLQPRLLQRPGFSTIGAYAAHHRCQMNHDFRARVGAHPHDGVRAAQVVVARTRYEYLPHPAHRNSATTWLPRNPAPPVTATRFPADDFPVFSAIISFLAGGTPIGSDQF